jgi:hypothetical protein
MWIPYLENYILMVPNIRMEQELGFYLSPLQKFPRNLSSKSKDIVLTIRLNTNT